MDWAMVVVGEVVEVGVVEVVVAGAMAVISLTWEGIGGVAAERVGK